MDQPFIPTQLPAQDLTNFRALLAKYGSAIKVATGRTSITASATAQAVAHGLGVVPSFVMVSGQTVSSGYPGYTSGAPYVSSTVPTSTDLYIGNSYGNAAITAYWVAVYVP